MSVGLSVSLSVLVPRSVCLFLSSTQMADFVIVCIIRQYTRASAKKSEKGEVTCGLSLYLFPSVYLHYLSSSSPVLYISAKEYVPVRYLTGQSLFIFSFDTRTEYSDAYQFVLSHEIWGNPRQFFKLIRVPNT